jgi:hypothetical protein
MSTSSRVRLTVLILIAFPGVVQAAFISWSYTWSLHPFVIPAEGTGGITITSGTAGHALGSASTAVGLLTTFSSAPPDTPDHFLNKSYRLHLDLTDDASGASGSLAFTGLLNGTLTATRSDISNTYTTDTTQALTLGDHTYTVRLDEFPAPPAPGSPFIESIQAHISVSASPPAPGPIQNTPEPSGFVLAALGLALVGMGCWRRCTRSA